MQSPARADAACAPPDDANGGAGAAAASPEDASEPWRSAACAAAADAQGLLWAQLRGFPLWPAQVVPSRAVEQLDQQLPPRGATVPADALLVQFFGTSEYAWVTRRQTVPWAAGLDKGKHTLQKLRAALTQAAGFAADGRRWPPGWWSLPPGFAADPVLPPAAAGVKRKAARAEPAVAVLGGGAGGEALAEGAAAARAGGSTPPQMPSYVKLRRNEWTRGAQPKPRSKAHSSVCECEPPPEFAAAAAASAAAAAAAAGDGDGAPAAKKARAAKPPTARLGCGGECQNRLTSTFCDSRTCPCGAACSNRPFHLLPLPRTKPFLTACGRGWGLKAAQLIPAGSFVVEYIGEILDDAQCGARLAADKEAGETNFYMMEVARNHVIDARYKGNVSRLINSSCAPNCETQRWVDGASGETRVGIFTLRDVQPGEELTYDYCFLHFGDDTSTSFRCMCGAPACRGTLDANPQRGLNRGRRIEVLWDDGQFYPATVTSYNQSTGKFKLIYDDGDTETVRLEADPSKRGDGDVEFRWLSNEGRPVAGAEEAPAEAPAEAADVKPLLGPCALTEGMPGSRLASPARPPTCFAAASPPRSTPAQDGGGDAASPPASHALQASPAPALRDA